MNGGSTEYIGVFAVFYFFKKIFSKVQLFEEKSSLLYLET